MIRAMVCRRAALYVGEVLRTLVLGVRRVLQVGWRCFLLLGVVECSSGGVVSWSERDRSFPPAPIAKPLLGSGASEFPMHYEVVRGDTLFQISKIFRRPLLDLIAVNRLTSPYRLHVGQVLEIPHLRTHSVQRGESLYTIARQHDVHLDSLVQRNNLGPPFRIYPGDVLRLPPTARSEDSVSGGVSRWQAEDPAGSARASSFSSSSMPSGVPAREGQFVWPVKGKVLSGYGPKPGGLHNDGINIASAPGSPVLAAESGVVVWVAEDLHGYGKTILIRHSEAYITVYAHNQEILVAAGERVIRGQVIAKAGSSGDVVRTQLHFQLRKQTQPVDPLKLLPKKPV